jgi:hypothetical protein
METEVSALMSAADKAIWNSADLFSSSDELSRHIFQDVPLVSAEHSPPPDHMTHHPPTQPTYTYPSHKTPPPFPTAFHPPALTSPTQPFTLPTLPPTDRLLTTKGLLPVPCKDRPITYFTPSISTCTPFPVSPRVFNNQRPSTQAPFDTSRSTRPAHKAKPTTIGGRRPNHRPWIPKKTKKKLVLGVDIGLENSVSMALCSPVGRLSYKYLCNTNLDD